MEILVNRAMAARDNYAVAYRNLLPKSAKELNAHGGIHDAVIHQLTNLNRGKEPLTMAAQAALVEMSSLSPESSVDSLVPSIYDQETLDLLPELKEASDKMAASGVYIPYIIMISYDELKMIQDEPNHTFVTIIFSFEMNRKDNKMHDDFFISTVDVSELTKNAKHDEGSLINFFPIVFNAPTMEILSTTKEAGVSAGFLFMENKEDTNEQ